MWLLESFCEIVLISVISGIIGTLLFLENITFGFELFSWFVIVSYLVLKFINDNLFIGYLVNG